MPGDLYHGDNLLVLREAVADESVDLIYLDPPFNSERTYHVVSRERGEARHSATREPAFFDTWEWDERASEAFAQLTAADAPAGLRSLMGTFRDVLWREQRGTLAYLTMMAIRLVEMRRVLRPTGSLYLHCDPTASHYLKVVLDAIFGMPSFRNEVVWRYRRWPTKAHRFQRMHDTLLFYTAGSANEHTFHTLYGYEQLAESTRKTFGTQRQRADFSSGRRKPSVDAVPSLGPPLSDFWDIDEIGAPLSDSWEIGVIAPIGKERTGYPTQKPEKLLERVVLASSNEGDVVLDPFCGSGTALVVAERLGRRWIGIDVAESALALAKQRLDKQSPDAWSQRSAPAPQGSKNIRTVVRARERGARASSTRAPHTPMPRSYSKA